MQADPRGVVQRKGGWHWVEEAAWLHGVGGTLIIQNQVCLWAWPSVSDTSL